MLRSLRRTLAPLALAVSSLFVLMPNIASAHNDDAYYHGTSNLPDNARWMAALPDSKPLLEVSMPGTHDSGARFGGDMVATQTLTITQQLKAGVRFLDIRLRHIGNVFAVHHGPVYQNAMFGDVLNEVHTFLADNPTETVLMRVKEEHTPENVTRHFEETFRKQYFEPRKAWFATPKSDNLKLGQARGKIVVLVDFGARDWFEFGIPYGLYAQDHWEINERKDLYLKWQKVKSHLELGNQQTSGLINYLSAAGMSWTPALQFVFPYFIASGHSSPGTSAPRLPTGLTTPGWASTYPDFPRVDCFIGICTIAYEGTNTLTRDFIKNRQPKFVGIVVADFPGAGLIRSIINVNPEMVATNNRAIVSSTNGKCLDIEGGAKAMHRLVTWDCHGAENQAFRFEGDQIKVGGLCLDVANGKNVHKAPVIAYGCGNGANQKWRLNANGTIQSLLGGEARCLDLATEDGGVVSMRTCQASSSDQRFLLVKPDGQPVANDRFSLRNVRMTVNETNAKCLDIEGGVRAGGKLLTWTCHGGKNQLFTYDYGRIRVGGMCLDVEGGSNVHKARVIAWPCTGGSNQLWRMEPDGTIQSLMDGERRCLDLAVEEGGAVSMVGCWPSSSDQRFFNL